MSQADQGSRALPLAFADALRLHSSGQLAAAENAYRALLSAEPHHFDALHMLGVIQLQRGKAAEALEWLERAVDVDPAFAPLWCNRAAAERALGRLEAATLSCERALALDPKSLQAHSALAAIHTQSGQQTPALRHAEAALALAPRTPELLALRAALRYGVGQLEDALADCELALELQPGDARTQHLRGALLLQLGRPQEALEPLRRAAALRSSFADAEWSQGVAHLMLGDFECGLPQLEWRRRRPKFASRAQARTRAMMPWLGEASLAGQRLLLHAEQGLGDTLQYCRYAAMAAERGAYVILEVQPPLVSLLARVAGVREVVALGGDSLEFDLHCPLPSLPLAFGTRLKTVPASVPYLSADSRKVQQWRERTSRALRPRVGIAWSGNSDHPDDRNRSMPLTTMLAHLPADLALVTLQTDIRPRDLETLQAHPSIEDPRADFEDTAALIETLDVVVCVDTSIAHLAGALGKATCVLLPFAADCRWLMDRRDSPWYPTVTLYRQRLRRDWDTPLAALGRDLLDRFDLIDRPLRNPAGSRR